MAKGNGSERNGNTKPWARVAQVGFFSSLGGSWSRILIMATLLISWEVSWEYGGLLPPGSRSALRLFFDLFSSWERTWRWWLVEAPADRLRAPRRCRQFLWEEMLALCQAMGENKKQPSNSTIGPEVRTLFSVLNIELRALCIPGKQLPTELYPHSLFFETRYHCICQAGFELTA